MVRTRSGGRYGRSSSRSSSSMVRSRMSPSRKQYSRKRARLSSPDSSSAPVSTQLDVRTRFVGRRGNRKRARAQRRFTGKVQSALMRLGPLRSWTGDNCHISSYLPNKQSFAAFVMGPSNTTGTIGQDDIKEMFFDCYSIATVPLANKTKLMIRSMCLDVQMRNSGEDPAIVDVYTLVLRGTQQGSLCCADYYASAWDDMTAVASSADKFNPATTPFQNPNFLSAWRIIKKQEVLLAVDSTVTLQLKTGRRKFMDGKQLEVNPAGIAGYTQALFFHCRGVPDPNAGEPQLTGGSITFAYQRTYSYAAVPTTLTSEGTHQD